jgi:hypothetical protein
LPFQSLKKVIKKIKKMQGIAILPHPDPTVLYHFINYIDGFEVINGRHPENNLFEHSNLPKFLNHIKAYGSDSHTIDEIGKIMVDVDIEILNKKGII